MSLNDKQFSPLFYTKRYRIKSRLKYKDWDSFKFRPRLSSKIPIMMRIWSKLHFLGSHSYMGKKWRGVEQKFYRAHQRLL